MLQNSCAGTKAHSCCLHTSKWAVIKQNKGSNLTVPYNMKISVITLTIYSDLLHVLLTLRELSLHKSLTGLLQNIHTVPHSKPYTGTQSLLLFNICFHDPCKKNFFARKNDGKQWAFQSSEKFSVPGALPIGYKFSHVQHHVNKQLHC